METRSCNNDIYKANNVLKQIEQVAKSAVGSSKDSIPSIFLRGNRGSGNSKFAYAYEKILATNHVYSIRGAKTFLELVFPRNGSNEDYQRFFQSPKIVASFQNQFYGVFAISFEEWDGNDLLISEHFRSLLTFIDNNRNNIFFVFQVAKEFKAQEELKTILNNHLNIVEVHLDYLDVTESIHYVKKILEDNGLKFSNKGNREFERLLREKLNIDAHDFAGYHSLQQIARNIQYELLIEDISLDDLSNVSDHMIRNIKDRVNTPTLIELDNRVMGFRI